MLPSKILLSRPAVAVTAAAAILMLQCSAAFAISSSTLRILSGQAVNDQFGSAAAEAGDFNHDGFPDAIVGAPNNDAGGLDAGRAYVFYGGPDSDDAPDVILTGAAAGDHFGISVAAAGDVNGDGSDDVIVGTSSAGGTGRAYVYFGGPSPNAVVDLTLVGAAAGDAFGTNVASAGDFNADRFGDVVVGAPLNDAGGISTDNRGRAYVYFGGSSPNSVADVIMTGAAAEDNFGTVQSASDFDGDGIDDLIVGAPGSSIIVPPIGRAYLFRGGIAPNGVADMTMNGAAAGDNFGTSVAAIGDVNGDGFPDFAVGAPGNDAVVTDGGRVYVFFGGPTVDTTPDLTLTGSVAFEGLGSSVAGAGDINQDGYGDLAVGAPDNNGGTGRVYVYFGSQFPNSTADVIFNGADVQDALGWSVAAVDLDHDGRPELIGGAPHNFAAGYPGTARILSFFTFDIVSPGRGATWAAGSLVTVTWFGHDIADLELSTDGGKTFNVLARGLGGHNALRGEDVSVASRPLGRVPQPSEAPAPDLAASHAIGNPDVKSFSIVCPDIPTDLAMVRLTMTGQTATRSNSDQSARFFIIHFKPSSPIAVKDLGAVVSSASPMDSIGAALASLDITGDGTTDILIGRPGVVGSSYGGTVTGFSDDDQCGNNPFPHPRPWGWGCMFTLHGPDAGDAFGFSIASIGDFNGDGFKDWIAGAPRALSRKGKAYVYFGGAVLDTMPDLILSGDAAGDQFGFAVAGAGDFNRDGLDDIAVAAPFENAGSGLVKIYYGSFNPQPKPPGFPDLVLGVDSPGENFGRSLAGGINLGAQAVPDPAHSAMPLLLVGAPFNDVTGSDAGAAYGFRGGDVPEAIPSMRLYGDQAGANFGWAVAGVGDINGDRVDDIAIGAPNHDGPHGINAGQVAIYIMKNPGEMPPPDVPCPGPVGPCCPWCLHKILEAVGYPGDQFGFSLGAMDVNADGLSDILIGAPGYDVGGGPSGKSNAGRIYGITGTVSARLEPEPIPWFVIDGPIAGKALGGVIGAVSPEAFSWGPEAGGALAAERARPHGVTARMARTRGERLAPPGTAEEPQPDPWGPSRMPSRAILATLRDTQVQLYDINRFHLLDDMAGVEWQVGSLQRISWQGNAAAQIDLSADGGHTWQPLAKVAARPGTDGTGPTGTKRSVDLRVPHIPTNFARIRIWPWPWPCLTCPPDLGVDVTDTLFTIRSSITLLSFTVQMGSEGASLAWSTDVAVSSDGIAGYRLYRMLPGASGGGQRVGPELITETHFTDPDAVPGAGYRLVGVNGLAEELELGEATLEAIQGFRVSPSPVSSRGSMAISFAAPIAAAGRSAADLDVGVFDVSGRRVADLAHGYAKPEAGAVRLTWNLTSHGSRVAPGLYIVRAVAPSAGLRMERKVVVLP